MTLSTPRKLLDVVREVINLKHYSCRAVCRRACPPITPKQVVAARNSYGGTGFDQVRLAIADTKHLMD